MDECCGIFGWSFRADCATRFQRWAERRRRDPELENIDAEALRQKRLERTVARRGPSVLTAGMMSGWGVWLRSGCRAKSGASYVILRREEQMYPLDGKMNRIVAMMRANVEHTFWVIKRQLARVKTRYRGVAPNSTQLLLLGKLFMIRRRLMA